MSIPIILSNSQTNQIRYIYHISDIHIRNLERQDEYRQVFEKTYDVIKHDSRKYQKQSLIVLTGDILHSKTDLSPDSMNLLFDLLISLSNILPVILIAGNHDCIVGNKKRMDALTPIVKIIKDSSNVHYLKHTGLYHYDNIIFGVTDVYTSKPLGSNQIPNELFDSIPQNNKYKIALFHGPIRGSQTYTGYEISSKRFRAKDFRGYDFAFFGDIHRYQYLNPEKTFAYSGSLIQQTYGESLDNHGVLKWDLRKKTSKLLEIKNDHGFCTVNISDGEILNLDDEFPLYPKIRLTYQNTNPLELKVIEDVIYQKYPNGIIETKTEIISSSMLDEMMDGNDELSQINVNHEKYIIKFLEKRNLNKQDNKNLLELHKSISAKVGDNSNNELSLTISHYWKIINLQFSNMFSYGEKNEIDFTHYNPHQIIGIFAPNHYGKSAVIDIMLFCLFGKCSRGKVSDIFNRNKTKMECSITLLINHRKVIIKRTGTIRPNKFTSTTLTLSEFDSLKSNDACEVITTKNEVEKKIVGLIGKYEDYLSTFICVQEIDKQDNFSIMTKQQQNVYLSKIFKLNIFKECHKYATETFKKHKILYEQKNKEMEQTSLHSTKERIKAIKNKYRKLKSEREHIKLLIDLDNFYLSLIKDPIIPKYHELSIYQINTINDINDVIDQLEETIKNIQINQISKNINFDQEQIILLQKQMIDYQEIDSYELKLEKLYERRVAILQIHQLLDLDVLIQDRDKLQSSLTNKSLRTVNVIKEDIIELEMKIEYVDHSCYQKLKNMKKTKKKIDHRITDLTDLDIDSVPLKDRNYYLTQLETREDDIQHIRHTKKLLKKYPECDEILKLQIDWLNKYEKWKKKIEVIINQIDEEMDINVLRNKSMELEKEIEGLKKEKIKWESNERIKEKIEDMKIELKEREQYDQMEKELKEISENIEKRKEYDKIMLDNKKLDIKIEKWKGKINDCKSAKKNLVDQIDSLNVKIKENQKFICDTKLSREHLKLLKIYQMEMNEYMMRKPAYDKVINSKNELTEKINHLNLKIRETELYLESEKATYQRLLKAEKERNKHYQIYRLHEMYCKYMHYDGIPYDIIKYIIPEMEIKINQTLSNMVQFKIQFVLYNSKDSTDIKGKEKLSNIGMIDINICYPNQEKYNIQTACGFEKFIINLAIRIVLCNISRSAKPNLFVIDEGWGCLDKENLSNVEHIMNYIKTQFDHVIIISHLEQLKCQADYVIDIRKDGKFSYIN